MQVTVYYTAPGIYTSHGNYQFTVPANVNQITVECWGGGGKGGNRTSRSGTGGSGGGGGGAYSSSVLSVHAGDKFTVNVGAGSTNTSDGGDSWFGTALLLWRKEETALQIILQTVRPEDTSASGHGDSEK